MNQEQHDLFINLLRATNRDGIENVIAWLEKSDFFTAPASTRFHGAYEGGLLEHSLNVHKAFENILQGVLFDFSIDKSSVTIAALLHDICKANTYKVAKRWRKDKQNQWEQYDTYEFDETEPMGHGEKSVMILMSLGLKLTKSEMYMIRWHMGGFDESKMALSNAMTKHPEIVLMHSADLFASYMLDGNRGDDECNPQT